MMRNASLKSAFASKTLLRLAGTVFFGLGLIGTVLPLMPTTVFWIVAAIFFARSHPEGYRRIVQTPRIGPVVDDFVTHRVIGREAKYVALGGMALSGIVVTALVGFTLPALLTWIGLALAAGVVLAFPEARPTLGGDAEKISA